MKRRTGLMMVAGLMLGAFGVNADPISQIPLMVCNNGITQPYSGLAGADTLARIDYDRHTDGVCGTYSDTLEGNTGTFNLAAGVSSFQLCYNNAANSLPARVCAQAGCNTGTATCSFEVRQLNTTGGIRAFGTGNCISVSCSGGAPQSWALVGAAGTLVFPS